MASVIRRGNKWCVAVYQGSVDDKKKYRYVFGFATSTDARRYAREIDTAKDKGISFQSSRMLFSEYLWMWLRDYVKPNLAPTTYDVYYLAVKGAIIPAIGTSPLNKLSGAVIQTYCANKLKTVSRMTVRHHLNYISGALEYAVKHGLLMFNPARQVEIPAPVRAEMHTLSPEEVSKFLETAKQTDFYELFFLLLYSGLRRGEALALRWSDIDLEMCQLSVTRSLHRVRGGEIIFTPPKTKRSRRNIDLTPSTAIVLRKLKDKQQANCTILGIDWGIDWLLFGHEDGRPRNPDVVSQAWRRVCKKTGFTVRLHDARHTHATLLFSQGAQAKNVQERLGHANISTTMDLYVHVIPEAQKQMVNKFDEAMKIKSGDC